MVSDAQAESFNDAITAIQLRDSERALSLCRDWHGPDARDPLLTLAQLCLDQGDAELGLAYYELAANVASDDPRVMVGKALALEAIGRSDEALAHLDAAARLAPDSVLARNNLGAALIDRGSARSALAHLERAVALAPEHHAARHNLGRAQAALGRRFAATRTFDAALALEPGNLETRVARRRLLTAAVPGWHFPMMNDRPRNEAYDEALRRAIRPGTHVLDIGTGAGLLTMMAHRAGAEHVTSCEIASLVAARAARVLASNHVTEGIKLLNRFSTSLVAGVDLPRRADVVVSEILSAEVLREGVLGTLAHAREHLMAEDGIMIPKAASAMIAPVCSESLEPYFRVEHGAGFDLSEFNYFTPGTVRVRMYNHPHRLLAPPVEAFRFEFGEREPADERVEISMTCDAPGRCLGVVQWIRIYLDDEVTYENPPDRPSLSSWMHVVHPFEEPVEVQAGDRLHIVAMHDGSTLEFVRVAGPTR